MCSMIGFPLIGIIGFGITVVYSEIRVPNPPDKITTFILIMLKNLGRLMVCVQLPKGHEFR